MRTKYQVRCEVSSRKFVWARIHIERVGTMYEAIGRHVRIPNGECCGREDQVNKLLVRLARYPSTNPANFRIR